MLMLALCDCFIIGLLYRFFESFKKNIIQYIISLINLTNY